jgi:hypothetical protein
MTASQRTIVDNRQRNNNKNKTKKHRFPYYLSRTEFMRPEVKKKKKKNSESIKCKPLESH